MNEYNNLEDDDMFGEKCAICDGTGITNGLRYDPNTQEINCRDRPCHWCKGQGWHESFPLPQSLIDLIQ